MTPHSTAFACSLTQTLSLSPSTQTLSLSRSLSPVFSHFSTLQPSHSFSFSVAITRLLSHSLLHLYFITITITVVITIQNYTLMYNMCDNNAGMLFLSGITMIRQCTTSSTTQTAGLNIPAPVSGRVAVKQMFPIIHFQPYRRILPRT